MKDLLFYLALTIALCIIGLSIGLAFLAVTEFGAVGVLAYPVAIFVSLMMFPLMQWVMDSLDGE